MKKIFLKILSFCIVVFTAFSLCSCFSFFENLFFKDKFSLSAECEDAISKINPDINLEIVFLNEKQNVKNDNSSVGGEAGLSYVHSTATQLASKFENISVSYHSLDDIAFLNQFVLTNNSIRLTKNSVIIMRTKTPGVVDGANFIIYHVFDFYFANSFGEVYAYNGEAKIVEAAIRLSMDEEQSVYFVSNHGGNNPVDTFSKLFENAGLNCELIDLVEKRFTCECGEVYTESYLRALMPEFSVGSNKDAEGNTIFLKNFVCENGCKKTQNVLDIDLHDLKAIPENARAIVIYEPQTDFSDHEIKMLEAYQKAKGNVMVFLDASLKEEEMSNFYEWLEVWGGLTINTDGDGYVTDAVNSFNDANTSILVKVPKNDATDVFLPGLSSSPDHFVVTEAVTITIKENRFEGDNTLTETLPIITTLSNAEYGKSDDLSISNKKEHVIMSLSKRGVILENPDAVSIAQDDFTSCLLVCTSGSFVDNDHLLDTQNSNQKVITALIAATTDAQIFSTNVEFKVFNDYSLTITGSEKIIVLVLSMTLLPIISLAVGFVVIYRRKRR